MDEAAPTRPTFNKIAVLLLVGSILWVYLPVRSFEFVNFDDGHYVSDNAWVQRGLTPQSVLDAFTTQVAGNWHPLTMLSHTLDSQLFGLDAGSHHMTSVAVHVINVLLLLLLVSRLTGSFPVAFFVAAAFGLHPLRVESVAWVSERKDVLSGLFWLLTTLAYVDYTKSRKQGRYVWVFAFLALGLMAKSMLVTLPFTLLLLDFWPLGRFSLAEPRANNRFVEEGAMLRAG